MDSVSSLAHASAQPPAGRGLYRFAVSVTIVVLALIKLGAMVTSTGSGMAYPDWPLANGSLLPADMIQDPAKFFEHFHRLVATFAGLLIVILAVWVSTVERRAWLRRLALGLVALVIIQGLIGGLGVLKNLPYATSITHGVLAQVIFCLLAFTAFALSPAWQTRTPTPAGSVFVARRLAGIALFAVFAQLVAGAVLRHTNLPGLLWVHVFMAIAVALAILIASLYASTRCAHVPGFPRLGGLVLGVLVTQLVLGFVTLLVRRVKDPSNVEHIGRSIIVSVHVVVGALLFLSAALLVYRTWRNLLPEEQHGRAG